jgi:hypothetical protein
LGIEGKKEVEGRIREFCWTNVWFGERGPKLWVCLGKKNVDCFLKGLCSGKNSVDYFLNGFSAKEDLR